VQRWFVVPDLSLWETAKPDLEALAEYHSPREVIRGYTEGRFQAVRVAGDSHNDLEAIREAGLGIAMGNAVDELAHKMQG